MGNFLFQTACAAAYAWRHGLEFTVPNRTNDPKWNPIYLQHLVNPKWNPNLPTVQITEEGHAYQELPFREEWRSGNIILDGYWQSEKYFKGYRQKILETFAYPWELMPGVVSFHVRRGDYLTLTKKHPPVTVDWMNRAMGRFSGYVFLFFSDDIAWCKQTFGDRLNCYFHEGASEVEDLIKMSHCEHHICSASTFSWWGAWLNRNPEKRIIIPDWWFVGDTPTSYKGLDTRDIVPSEWERMGN